RHRVAAFLGSRVLGVHLVVARGLGSAGGLGGARTLLFGDLGRLGITLGARVSGLGFRLADVLGVALQRAALLLGGLVVGLDLILLRLVRARVHAGRAGAGRTRGAREAAAQCHGEG